MDIEFPKIGHSQIDHHHQEVFQLVSMLDTAVRDNSREGLEGIILFLEAYVVDHFSEEEDLMRVHSFEGLDEHEIAHNEFREQVLDLRRMFDETSHSTHLMYAIRRFIDELTQHIITIDIKIAPLVKGDH